MQVSKNIGKIFWMIADKLMYVIYGIATIALLQVTNSTELGIFALFNSLHNFILVIAGGLGSSAMLQFAAYKDEITLINFYCFINFVIVCVACVLIVFALQTPLSIILKEPRFTDIVSALPLLILLSIPRYFIGSILLRDVAIFKSFLTTLSYCGTMSGMIFYNVWCNNFLDSAAIIHINYVGSAVAVLVGMLLTHKQWRFSLPKSHPNNTIVTYKNIVTFCVKSSISSIIQTIPKQLDVYLVQYFFGLNVVGLYSPAKTMFRFIEDILNAIGGIIYSTVAKCFYNNDIAEINNIISKIISMLFLLFIGLIVVFWLTGSYLFPLFLPVKFANAYPIFKVLMLASIALPAILLSGVMTANGLMTKTIKFAVISLTGWLTAFVLIGNLFAEATAITAIPYLIFNVLFAVQLWLYAEKHYQLHWKQLVRIITDTYKFIQLKIKK